MTVAEAKQLGLLYGQDETAWLEAMATLAAEGRWPEMDFANLSEYLADMARRDRREVFSRLVLLLAHLLKWEYQPEKRGGSWRGTIRAQRRDLRLLLESGTLRAHAAAVFSDAYTEARRQAADESELDVATFPDTSPWTLEEAVGEAGD
jgi:hypothetical protein